MPVSVLIECLTPTIDMYGSPDTFSAYSLCGHITVKVTAGSSILGFPRSAQNILLSSLELTFEGQTELLFDDVGYTSLRIVSITKELVSPSNPIHISVDNDQAEWRFIFNLAVPGWLPGTSAFGDNDEEEHVAGINYALHACARFVSTGADGDQGPSNTLVPSIWNSLCSVVQLGPSRPKTVHAVKVPIVLTRYASPPSHACEEERESPPVFPRSLFAVEPTANSAFEDKRSTNIPMEILRSIQVRVVVPSRTSVDDDRVPLGLQLRRQNGDEGTNDLKLLGFEADVVQVETYHTSPPSRYTARFPLLPAEQQPSSRPFEPCHPLGALYEMGILSEAPPDIHVARERSLVTKGANVTFEPHEGDSPGNGVPMQDNWSYMEVDVPVPPGSKARGKRISGTSPLFDVYHEARIHLMMGYKQPGKESKMLSEELSFAVPLKFVNVMPPPASGVYPLSGHLYARSTSSVPLSIPPMTWSTPTLSHALSLWSLRTAGQNAAADSSPSSPSLPLPQLPAYSQLYHENGVRKEDGSALPVYHEREDTPSCGGTDSDSCGSTLSRSSSCSELRILPDMPRTPPGLAGCRTTPGGKYESKEAESFLVMDEEVESEEEELEGWCGTARGPGPECDLDVDPREVQYGIAF